MLPRRLADLLHRAAEGRLDPAEQRLLGRLVGRRSWGTTVVVAGLLLAGGLVAQTVVPGPTEVFATVNQEDLTWGDYTTALQDQVGAEIAERLIFETLIRQEAEKHKLVPTAEDLDARIRQIVAERFGGNAAQFSAWLVEAGHDEESFKRRVGVELMDLRVRTRGVQVTEEKLRAWFQEQQTRRYDLPETVRYRQVVLDTQDQATEVLKQIQSGDLAFFSAAARHSLDPAAAETGGLIGPEPLTGLAALAPPLHEALAKLQANEVAPQPVEYKGKWFLLLMIERTPGQAVKFEDLQERVRWDWLNEQAVPEQQFYQELAKTAKVVGLPLRYRAVEATFAAAAAAAAKPAPTGPVTPQPGRQP